MLEALISNLMPHYCISCGEIGDGLCDYCKYDIELAPVEQCLICHVRLDRKVCREPCGLAGFVQLIAGTREGILARLLVEYKFQPARAYASSLITLLDRHTPILPSKAVIVPIPTAAPHVRQRGFDHMLKLAKELARARALKVQPVLWRQHNQRQVGASRSQRIAQAQSAFRCSQQLSPDVPYIVFDDVVTTGSTVVAACEQLKRCGAKQIIVLAVCRQVDDTKSL